MNNDLDYKISVMQAYRAGEKIEHRNTKRSCGGETKWFETSDPQWDWWNCDYRVKAQEPEVVWISDTTTGLRCVYSEAFIPADTIDCKSRKFVELTPEVRAKLGL